MAHVLRILCYMLKAFLVLVLCVTTIVIIRTVNNDCDVGMRPLLSDIDYDIIKLNEDILLRFRTALRFQTVSRTADDINLVELVNMKNFIMKSYPTVHSSSLVEFETVANYSLLYHVIGSDSKLTPYLLMSHMDVVPADDGDQWEASPFSGDIRGKYIYGRGAIDVKQTLFGMLEAVEYALEKGYRFKRSFYMAFGHDEEVLGLRGAASIAKLLHERHIKFQFILDEGTTILQDVVTGVRKPTAIISCSEKGFLHLRLSVNTTGGHSSMPEKESSIGILAAAVARLENNPHPHMLGKGPESKMFVALSNEMPFYLRIVMSNIWLFKPVLDIVLSMKPTTNAIIRTTTAVTQFHAGVKDNVISPWAWAIVNNRVHPGQTLQQVLDYNRAVINDDRVKMEVKSSFEAHPISPSEDDTLGYQTIKTSIEQIWAHKDVVVAPGLMIANTDTRYYLKLSSEIYRFGPTFMFPEDMTRFHGLNERISIENYEQVINFYYHLMRNADIGVIERIHKHGAEL